MTPIQTWFSAEIFRKGWAVTWWTWTEPFWKEKNAAAFLLSGIADEQDPFEAWKGKRQEQLRYMHGTSCCERWQLLEEKSIADTPRSKAITRLMPVVVWNSYTFHKMDGWIKRIFPEICYVYCGPRGQWEITVRVAQDASAVHLLRCWGGVRAARCLVSSTNHCFPY